MARGRMIASTVADDKRFNELPVDAALVYLMAIPQLDRDGLILGEPGVLWGQVCRRRADLMPRMEAIIKAWIAAELVTAYKNEDGDTILYFTGFQKNQAMTHYDREAASRFPCPPGYARTAKGLVQDEVKRPVKGWRLEQNSNGYWRWRYQAKGDDGKPVIYYNKSGKAAYKKGSQYVKLGELDNAREEEARLRSHEPI